MYHKYGTKSVERAGSSDSVAIIQETVESRNAEEGHLKTNKQKIIDRQSKHNTYLFSLHTATYFGMNNPSSG